MTLVKLPLIGEPAIKSCDPDLWRSRGTADPAWFPIFKIIFISIFFMVEFDCCFRISNLFLFCRFDIIIREPKFEQRFGLL